MRRRKQDVQSAIGVVIVEAHRRASERLVELCAHAPDLELRGLLTTASDALDRIMRLQPAVAVLDAGLWPCDLLAAIRHLLTHAPSTRLVVLVPTAESPLVYQLIQVGVTSVVLHTMTGETLLQIIRAAAHGDGFVPREILPSQAVVGPIPGPTPFTPDLTRREREIVGLIAQRQSNQAIADTLKISVATVKTYKKRIKDKSPLPASE